jgi:CubicO group peptidase (beta-lactamase class C family)
MGGLSSWETFGHNGSSCCIAWADPSLRIAFAYLTNLLLPGRVGALHQAAVADAILGSCE